MLYQRVRTETVVPVVDRRPASVRRVGRPLRVIGEVSINQAAWRSLAVAERGLIVGAMMGFPAAAICGLLTGSFAIAEMVFLASLLLVGIVELGRFPTIDLIGDDYFFVMVRRVRRTLATFIFVIVACAVFAAVHLLFSLLPLLYGGQPIA